MYSPHKREREREREREKGKRLDSEIMKGSHYTSKPMYLEIRDGGLYLCPKKEKIEEEGKDREQQRNNLPSHGPALLTRSSQSPVQHAGPIPFPPRRPEPLDALVRRGARRPAPLFPDDVERGVEHAAEGLAREEVALGPMIFVLDDVT